MFLSERAVLGRTFISITSDAFRRIGIRPDSTCWGVWLPYQNLDLPPDRHPKGYPSHLAISPFRPETWPCLLNIRIKLNDRAGVVHTAMRHLADNGLNVLSHAFSQSGHNHGTLTAIATVPGLLNDNRLSRTIRSRLDRDSGAPPIEAHSDLDGRQQWVNDVLRYISSLESALLKKHNDSAASDGGFLRPRFLRKRADSNSCGLAFDLRSVPGDLRSIAARQFPHAITIAWLQYPAYYWFHCAAADQPIALKSDSTATYLTVDTLSENQFLRSLPDDIQRDPHIIRPALVSIEPAASIVRVMPFRTADGEPLEITIAHYYRNSNDTHSTGQRSTGLLGSLTGIIKQSGGNLWHMSNGIEKLTPTEDSSTIKIIVTEARPLGNRPHDLRTELQAAFSRCMPPATGLLPANTEIKPPRIRKFDCLHLFVSKRQDWWIGSDGAKYGESFAKHLDATIRSQGCEMITNPSSDPLDNGVLRDNIVSQIQSCHGFVLVIPNSIAKDPAGAQWLQFELGVACGVGMPTLILAEDRSTSLQAALQSPKILQKLKSAVLGQRSANPGTVDALNMRFKTTQGREYFLFTRENYRNVIDDSIQRLVQGIKKYGPRTLAQASS